MPCEPAKSNADRLYTVYDQYYSGERDEENRKNGLGAHHWTGAKSLEWYEGQMLRDTMHGAGEYFARYQGRNHAAMTYEGCFYNNSLHGYGVMSYPDGQVYNGLFYNNSRWGPGIVSHADTREDVGLWSGTQLVRLAWKPPVPSVAIDLASTQIGCDTVAPFRIQLYKHVKTIGEVNSALELLKQCGTNPVVATEKWTKLYPKSCTDTKSQLCNVQAFDRAYYDSEINTLIEITDSTKMGEDTENYYAWNNNKTIIHMMKHCYKHERQRAKTGINLKNILSGHEKFKQPGKHEVNCRTLLMASYLGHIANVAQLVNECDVNPNVTDVQGNSAVMYAACGDQTEIIHFLVDAGAKVDYYNDTCCTPLGVSLLRFALARWDVAPNDMVNALLPRELHPDTQEGTVLEWNIERMTPPTPTSHGTSQTLTRTPSKTNKLTKSTSQKNGHEKKKEETKETFVEEDQDFRNISNEYIVRVNEAYSAVSAVNPVQYLFEVVDVTKDVILTEGEVKKPSEKTKMFKDSMRPSREIVWQSNSKEGDIVDTKKQMKEDTLGRIMLTILQLLSEGADPRKVRCPQPAIFIASAAVCGELIDYLVQHGADVNESYPQAYGCTPLDIALGGQLTYENLKVIRSLLKNGASVDHRLNSPPPPILVQGSPPAMVSLTAEDDKPTLLIAALFKHVESEDEEDILHQLLQLLLEYGCDPTVQCHGRSALDIVLTKSMEIFDIFIKSPSTDLNAIINNTNQNILMKMFYLPFCRTMPLPQTLQMITNLLLFGADPFLKCQFGDESYDNLFVYINKNLAELGASRKPSPHDRANKQSTKNLKIKSSKKNVSTVKAPLKSDDYSDYKQTSDLVMECARLLYVRWLQAKLLKELIEVVNRYSHRHWHMILREYKNQKCTGLWINTARALEIWDILKTTKKKIYNSDRILKHTLRIIHYCFKKSRKEIRGTTITTKLKSQIESEVYKITREHKLDTVSDIIVPYNSTVRPYVTPELTEKGLEKYNICFECGMPLIPDTKILCMSCKLISFCSFVCIKMNVEKTNCHPCSSHLKNKYIQNSMEMMVEEQSVAHITD